MKHIARSAKDIGQAIRVARKQKKMTQSDLAELSGVWQETISKIERGQGGMKLELIFELMTALELELEVRTRQKYNPEKMEDIF